MNPSLISNRRALLLLVVVTAVVVLVCVYLISNPAESPRGKAVSSQPSSTAPVFVSPELDAAGQSWRARAGSATLGDFRSLMNDALQIQDSELRETAVAEIVVAWMNQDPQNFAAYFASLEVLATTDDMPQRVVMAALKKALTQLSAETAASHHVLTVIERFVAHTAKSDPNEALRWARQFLLNDALDNALVTIAREFARRSPEQGQQIIAEIEAPLRRMQAMHAVGSVWAQQEPAQALAWAGALSAPTERALTMNSVLLSVAQKDVPLASAELAATQSKMAQEYAAKRKADLAALKLTEEDLVNDPERYKEMLEAGEITPPVSPDIELLAESGRVIATRLAETDPMRAIAWADSLEHEFLKLKSITGALAGWARTSPAEAFAYQQRTYPQYDDMLTSVFESWATANPEVAANATLEIPEPGVAQRALETVVQRWVASGDVGVVTKWVDQLPASLHSDSLEVTLVSAFSSVAPEQSWKRAQGIGNERLKYRALKSAFSVLVMERPDVARSLLDSAGLDVKHAERLREMLDAVGAGD